MAPWVLLFLPRLGGDDYQNNNSMNKPRLIFASTLAAITTIVFVVVITVWAELSSPLKDWLKNFSGHHWTSKSIFSALWYVVATAVLYFVYRGQSENHVRAALVSLLICTALGTIILATFYTGHHFNIY